MTFVSAEVTPAANSLRSHSGRIVECSLGTVDTTEAASGQIVVEVVASASENITATAATTPTTGGGQLDSTPADNDDSATTELDAPPRKITGLSASGKPGHIDLIWSAPGDNGSPITGYELERRYSSDDFAL